MSLQAVSWAVNLDLQWAAYSDRRSAQELASQTVELKAGLRADMLVAKMVHLLAEKTAEKKDWLWDSTMGSKMVV